MIGGKEIEKKGEKKLREKRKRLNNWKKPVFWKVKEKSFEEAVRRNSENGNASLSFLLKGRREK